MGKALKPYPCLRVNSPPSDQPLLLNSRRITRAHPPLRPRYPVSPPKTKLVPGSSPHKRLPVRAPAHGSETPHLPIACASLSPILFAPAKSPDPSAYLAPPHPRHCDKLQNEPTVRGAPFSTFHLCTHFSVILQNEPTDPPRPLPNLCCHLGSPHPSPASLAGIAPTLVILSVFITP